MGRVDLRAAARGVEILDAVRRVNAAGFTPRDDDLAGDAAAFQQHAGGASVFNTLNFGAEREGENADEGDEG
jgi:hypothetical protein